MESNKHTGDASDYDFDYELKDEILEEARNWQPSEMEGDYRTKEASSKGGFALRDSALTSKLRSAGKEVLYRLGRQILNGKFNLVGISFPIKCAADYTMLQALTGMARVNPYIMNAAALAEDPIERMKLLITAGVSHMEPCNTFEKPLNPILGETYHAYMDDGTQIYCEQTSHHPPISHIHIVGPDNLYEFSMHSGYSASAWVNSITVNVIGHKYIIFKDGTKISWNNLEDMICNTLWGTMTRQITGKQEFKDETNHIHAYIETGAKSTQDYIKGKISMFGQEIYDIKGNYNGYIDFNKKRYWDIRETKAFEVRPGPNSMKLESDSRNRSDLLALKTESKDSDIPQDKKDALENEQRYDAKLRKAVLEYREANPGTKYVDMSLLAL